MQQMQISGMSQRTWTWNHRIELQHQK